MNFNNNQLTITMANGTKVEISQNNSCETTISTVEEKAPSKLHLNPEKGWKLNMIRLILVAWEMGFFVDEHGHKAKKKDTFQAFGNMLNTDFAHFNSDISASLADGSSMDKHIRVFEEMLEKMKQIFNQA